MYYQNKDNPLIFSSKDNGGNYFNTEKLDKMGVYDIKSKKFITEEGKMRFDLLVKNMNEESLNLLAAKIASYCYNKLEIDPMTTFEQLLKSFNPLDVQTQKFQEVEVDHGFVKNFAEISYENEIKQKATQIYKTLFKINPNRAMEEMKKNFNSEEDFIKNFRLSLGIKALKRGDEIEFLTMKDVPKLKLNVQKIKEQIFDGNQKTKTNKKDDSSKLTV